MARVQSIIKKNAYCCPNCKYEIFSTLGHYYNHDVKVEAGTITTPWGSAYLSHARQVILLGLLEAYPKPITRESLTGYYEFYVESSSGKEPAADLGGSVDVQMVHIRRLLAPIGISIHTLWGAGWRVGFVFGKPKP